MLPTVKQELEGQSVDGLSILLAGLERAGNLLLEVQVSEALP